MTNPNWNVENLAAPTRAGMTMTAKWEVPAACLKTGANDRTRFEGLDILWVFDANPKSGAIKRSKLTSLPRESTSKNSQKTDSESIPRKSFYPLPGKPKLTMVDFWVRGYNWQGTKRYYGPWSHRALTFAVPEKPALSMTYDSSTGIVTMTYTATQPDGAAERYDTLISMTVHNTKNYVNAAYTGLTTSFTAEVPQSGTLAIGEFRKATGSATNRGFAGNSATATATLYVCHPNPPVCGTPSLLYATKGVLTTAALRIPLSSAGNVSDGSTVIRPSEITLQRLKNYTSATNASGAASSQGWQDVASDNGATSGLSDTWVNAVSDDGKFTWYRFVSKRDGYSTYGVPVQARCINVPDSSQTTGRAKIDTIASGEDGKSLVITMSGKEYDDDGYEVSWADSTDAWASTVLPSTFETTESSLVIKGLTEGTEYYVKARAFDVDSSGVKHYGAYSDMKSEIPITTPSTVVLSGPRMTPRGSNIVVSWIYDVEQPQTQWRLVDLADRVKHSGSGASTNFIITPDMYGSASYLSYAVEMTTGGGWARSAPIMMSIADPPTCSLDLSNELEAQPIAFDVASSTGDKVRVVVTALGSSGTGLHGDRQQYAGDTVYSAVHEPTWATVSNVRTASIELPAGLALFDGAAYRVDVTAVDDSSGLASETQTAEFEVVWAHKAQQPTATATASQIDMSVTVTVAAPVDYVQGDRFDLYRVTSDGERLIASAQPFGTAVTDRLAPYSSDGANLRYMAVTRTADGGICISEDIVYALKGSELRFDWSDKHVELPYNLELSDTVSTDSETRKHMDGESESYAENGYSRRSSLSASMTRFEDAGQHELVREMLQHPGSVFVRTPDGLAFAAQITPGTISRTAGDALESVDITAQEHALTDGDKPTATDISVPQWGGGAVEALNGVVYDSEGGFPMDDWVFVGYDGATLYVCDPDNVVRDGDGELMLDWVFDGISLWDENGDEVAVTDEPEE